jgi:hypothetical protein
METEKRSKFITHKIMAVLNGMAPILFDKFKDHSSPDLPEDQKLYVADGLLVLPAANLTSFLVGEYPAGIIKVDKGKKFAEFTRIVKSHLSFGSPAFPILDGQGREIKFDSLADRERWGTCLEGGLTKSSGGKIIKQEAKPRPFLKLPWKLAISINLFMTDCNKIVTPDVLQDWFIKGGVLVGLGSYRPLYGRFEVDSWEVETVKI